MTQTQMVEAHVSDVGVTWRRNSIWIAGALLAGDDEKIVISWDGKTVEIPRTDLMEARYYHWEPSDRGPAWQVKVYDTDR